MYSATTSSVTLPLLQQKYPRAHKCRPQNCFRNGVNSCNILYAVFPFSGPILPQRNAEAFA